MKNHLSITDAAVRILASATPTDEMFVELSNALPTGWTASIDYDTDLNSRILIVQAGFADSTAGGYIATGDYGIAFYPFSGGEDYDIDAAVSAEAECALDGTIGETGV